MAIEHSNGDFEIGEFKEMRDKFFEMVGNDLPVNAFHVGSFEELHRRAEEKPIKQRLDELEAKVKETEIVRSEVLHLPTKGDIDKFGSSL